MRGFFAVMVDSCGTLISCLMSTVRFASSFLSMPCVFENWFDKTSHLVPLFCGIHIDIVASE